MQLVSSDCLHFWQAEYISLVSVLAPSLEVEYVCIRDTYDKQNVNRSPLCQELVLKRWLWGSWADPFPFRSYF